MIAHTLVVSVGTPAAKAIFRLWAREQSVGTMANAALSDVVSRGVPGWLEQRRTAHFFERVAEEVAEKLEPFFEAEFTGLPENEREAVAWALGETLEQRAHPDLARSLVTARCVALSSPNLESPGVVGWGDLRAAFASRGCP